MTSFTIKAKLSRLLLTCPEDIITKADNIKRVGKQVELTNPIDYTKEEFKKKFNGNKMISQWGHTTDNGIDKLVVVIKD